MVSVIRSFHKLEFSLLKELSISYSKYASLPVNNQFGFSELIPYAIENRSPFQEYLFSCNNTCPLVINNQVIIDVILLILPNCYNNYAKLICSIKFLLMHVGKHQFFFFKKGRGQGL